MMKNFYRSLFLILIFSCSIRVLAQTSPIVFIRDKAVKLDGNNENFQQLLHDNRKGDFFYLQFDRFPDTTSLAHSGFFMEDYLNNNIWLFYVVANHIPPQINIKGWAEVDALNKISSYLLKKLSGDSSANVKVLVAFSHHIKDEKIVQELSDNEIEISRQQPWKSRQIWEVSLPLHHIKALAQSTLVKYINPQFDDQPFNDRAIGITDASIAHQPTAIGGYALKGEGVTIGIGDDANPQTNIDFNDRVTAFNPALQSYHGFHTAGTAAGAGNVNEKYAGFAPKANIVSQFFSGVFAYAPSLYNDYGMRITNNSYGNVLGDCSYAGTYDIYAQYLDDQIRQYPKLLHVFAAGNDGQLTCGPYPAGFHTTAGSYQPAKNVLVVGNAQNSYDNILRVNSSRGPVKDGRIKPEIVALGFYVNSDLPNNLYGLSSGTSMACPNVSGAATLLYQLYKNLHNGSDPEAALVKLLLMNGATDILNAGPDFKTGFGLMNVAHSLKAMNGTQYFSNNINTGQLQDFTFSIPANTAKAKVMLYWDDPAATPEASTALINDLDLTVTNSSGNITLPLVLNPADDQLDVPATNGADHLNNVEQVVLNNPAAGNYTIKVKGYNVPLPDQKYYVSYDFQPTGIAMQSPYGGEMLRAGDSTAIYWEASDDAGNFSVDYSIDNGSSWTNIGANISSTLRNITWQIPSGTASGNCKIRVTRNAQQAMSHPFTIIASPVVTIAPVEEQCPGSVKFNWTSVPNATKYDVYLLDGREMVLKDQLPGTATSYTFSGLDINTIQWVSVAAEINGKRGLRAIAKSRVPNNGNCSGYTNGDLALTQILSPQNGRQLTSTALSGSEILTVRVYNLSGTNNSQYRIAYSINNGSWQQQHFTTSIAPSGFADLSLTAIPLGIGAPGDYNIAVAITNLLQADDVSDNDTIRALIRNVENQPIAIDDGYTEGFEGVNGLDEMHNEFGMNGAHHWDFAQSKPKGRVRSFVTDSVTINGGHSISMDNNFVQQGAAIAQSSFNTLTGTFNLSNYDINVGELRCEMDYRLHGVPKFADTGNRVWIRGSDTSQWVLVHTIDTNDIGLVHTTGSISFNDFLLNHNQHFSSSTQIKIEQYDTSLICGEDFGNGLTVDNFKMYFVTSDVQLLSIDSIHPQNCTMAEHTPLTVKVRNGVLYALHDIPISYSLDGGSVINDTIPLIAAKDTVDFTFSQTMDMSSFGAHVLSVWVHLDVDSYHQNDSILKYEFYNQPTVTAYPYLQDFENSNGNFYMSNDSVWQYGTPQSTAISYAASGSKAWKTNLTGFYQPNTTSYLYSPCFDISTLSHPTLSFSLAYNIEPRGDQLFDNGFVEYSHDGVNWNKLGTIGSGTNWYNDSADVWQGKANYWHVATASLPSGDIIMFRFVMKSDAGAEFDGMAIDDIHIYDLQNSLYDASSQADVENNVGQNASVVFVKNNNLLSSIDNTGASLNSVKVTDYPHDDYINMDSMQYFLPRNFSIKTNVSTGIDAKVRLFVPDSDMDKLREDNSCPSCSPVKEVYRLGITKYSNDNKDIENDKLSDNEGGEYQFIPFQDVRWVPYDKGYYAEVAVHSFSEFWFNDGGPGADKGLNESLLEFNVSHQGSRFAKLDWTCFSDNAVSFYNIERSGDNQNFELVNSIDALRQSQQQSYTYVDTPFINSPVVYYRLHYRSAIDSTRWFYSPVRKLDWNGAASVNVYPNPISQGVVYIDWIKNNDAPLMWAIYNVAGQRLAQGSIEDNTYNGKTAISLNRLGLPAGLLLMKVKSGSENWDFKLVYYP